ncbi:hypothetical protein J2X68_007623 [Streptomyces sp. 3330]|uniref:hypothetical protein n=1 Tax=Streptomyces sp. 3330 TaxID=2817755 RepID=UPI0028613F2A|nr:hypothetical protein [Streptomyces sp. 3330]MDR6980881.1 hypothetical protein [Streptomyces sp. 3330]
MDGAFGRERVGGIGEAHGLVGVGDCAGGRDGPDAGGHLGGLRRQLDLFLTLGDQGLGLEPVDAQRGHLVQ